MTILFGLVLSPKEKEDLVMDMLNKGYTIREIAKAVHVSFSFIGNVRKKMSGEFVEEHHTGAPKTISINSQVFKLLKEGKSLIDVTIILDVPKDEIIHFFSDYLTLQNMNKVVKILKEHRNNIPAFVKLFEFIRKNNTKSKDMGYAINNINNINFLKQQREDLKKEIESIIEERNFLLDNAGEIKNTSY